MVFRTEVAPKDKVGFIEWYDAQTEWSESHNYDDPKNSAKELQGWYYEMIKLYPPTSLHDSKTEEENYKFGDYSLGHNMIYASFPWPEADNVNKLAKDLASKHKVGFYDVSGTTSIYFFEIPKDAPTKRDNSFFRIKAYSIFRNIGVLTGIASLLVLVFGLKQCQPKDVIFVILFAAILVGLSIPLLLSGFVENLKVFNDKLVKTDMLNTTKVINWEDIKSISFSKTSLMLTIQSSKNKIRVYLYSDNFGNLLNLIEQKTKYTRDDFEFPHF